MSHAQNTFDEVVASVQAVASLAHRISAATDAQATGIARVNAATRQLDVMTQQNTRLVQESAASATDLNRGCLALNRGVEVFRLPQHG